MFENIESGGIDQLMKLMQEFRNDPRDQKVDLVVGVYKDDAGDVPVMRAVKSAEARVLEAEPTKNYVGISGNTDYNRKVPALLLGEDHPVVANNRFLTTQTVGGSGALRIGFEFAKKLSAGSSLWVSSPTWANHIPVAEAVGLDVKHYPYFRHSDRGLDFEGMLECLSEQAQPGDFVLLHACCHNPTGIDLQPGQWVELTKTLKSRNLVPFVDCAYQGLGDGMEADVQGLRGLANEMDEMIIASSFSKNFGIYRERAGALTLVCRTAGDVSKCNTLVQSLARTAYSMPPSHGATVVDAILSDSDLTAEWSEELNEMRDRIGRMRVELRSRIAEFQVSQDLSFLTDQKGMFSYTGFQPTDVELLRDKYGIYIAGDGRINVAGLCTGNLDYVAEAFAQVLRG